MSKHLYISVQEFMQHLKDNDLVIVNQKELTSAAEIKRTLLLKKKDLSLTEVVRAGFFDIKDTETLRRWCLIGKFGHDGYYRLGNGQFRILTLAIKKVLYV